MATDRTLSLSDFREILERCWDSETWETPDRSYIISGGQSQATAVVVNQIYGASIHTTVIRGETHWFNRINQYDIDFTGDQWNMPAFQMNRQGELHCQPVVNIKPEDVPQDIRARADILFARVSKHDH